MAIQQILIANNPASGPAGNTLILLHMDGTNGSTSFPDDVTSNTWAAVADAQVSTSSPQYGTGALLLDGTGDYLQVPRFAALAFGTGDFTIEAWIKTSASPANSPNIFSTRSSSGLALRLNSSGVLQYFNDAATPIISGGAALNDGNWHHVAVCRASGTTRIFRDGSQVASAADTFNHTFAGMNATPRIGNNTSGSENFNGRIDEFRVSRVARYTSGFTPAGPFTLD